VPLSHLPLSSEFREEGGNGFLSLKAADQPGALSVYRQSGGHNVEAETLSERA
jgi:hypothetical protein